MTPHSLQALMQDREKLEELLSYLQAGATLASACAALPIDARKVRGWIERGTSARKGVYRQFADEVRSACGRSWVTVEATIKDRNPLQWANKVDTRTLIDTAPNPWKDAPPATLPTAAINEHPSPTTTLNIAALLKEWVDAGLITITEAGQGLINARPPGLPSPDDDAGGA